MKRLFVCVVPPAHVLETAVRLQAPLVGSRGFRPVPRENMHITVLFIGDVAETSVGGIIEALGSASLGHRPISLKLTSVGCFPNFRKPDVVWVGVSDPSGELRQLACAVYASAARTGHPLSNTRFRPHLTLARVRRSVAQPETAGVLRTCLDADVVIRTKNDHPLFQVDALVLMESLLGPTGATHTPIVRVPLHTI